MNELQIFNSEEFGEIRTIEIDGKPYFVATDVATALGYVNPRKADTYLEDEIFCGFTVPIEKLVR